MSSTQTINLSSSVPDILLHVYSQSYATHLVGYPELFENIVQTVRAMTLSAFEARLHNDASSKSNVDLQILLATLYWTLFRNPKKLDSAFSYYDATARQGHSESQFFLAQMYDLCQRTQGGHRRALDFYVSAANRTQDRAQIYLGLCCQVGYLCGREPEKAVYWYDLARSQIAQSSNLLMSVRENSGMTQFTLATYLRKKAEILETQLRSLANGVRAEFGLGVPCDKAKAASCYREVAEAGLPEAQCALAILFRTGQGVPLDITTSNMWLQRAAEQGNPFAAYVLNPGNPAPFQRPIRPVIFSFVDPQFLAEGTLPQKPSASAPQQAPEVIIEEEEGPGVQGVQGAQGAQAQEIPNQEASREEISRKQPPAQSTEVQESQESQETQETHAVREVILEEDEGPGVQGAQAQEIPNQEAPRQEILNQETPAQSTEVQESQESQESQETQETHAVREVILEEEEGQEAQGAQGVQGAQAQEIPNQEAPNQEISSQEPPAQSTETQETQESQETQEIHAVREVILEEDEGQEAQGLQGAQGVQGAQGAQAQEIPNQEAPRQEISNQESPAQSEVQAQESREGIREVILEEGEGQVAQEPLSQETLSQENLEESQPVPPSDTRELVPATPTQPAAEVEEIDEIDDDSLPVRPNYTYRVPVVEVVKPSADFMRKVLQARGGNPEMQRYIGEIYEDGEGVGKNLEKSFEWYSKAAKNEDSFALYCVAQKYFFGIGVQSSPSIAFLMMYRVVQQRETYDAAMYVSKCYVYGYGIEKNLGKAKEYAKLAERTPYRGDLFPKGLCAKETTQLAERLMEVEARAFDGDVTAQFALGIMYSFGIYEKKWPSRARYWLKKAADAGNGSALYQLGFCAATGLFTEQSHKDAVMYYEAAAKKFHPDAYCSLGEYYYKGEHVEKRDRLASSLLKRAHDLNLPRASYFYGLLYLNGKGNVSSNVRLAYKCFSEGAAEGDVNCIYQLGRCHENGVGVRRDLDVAVRYYQRAADLGNYEAISHLSSLYFGGYEEYSDDDDDDDAHLRHGEALLRAGAEGGDFNCQYALAMRYYKGDGVEQNLEEAKHWFEASSQSGNLFAAVYAGILSFQDTGIEHAFAKALTRVVDKYYETTKGKITLGELRFQASKDVGGAQVVLALVEYIKTHNLQETFTWLEKAAESIDDAKYVVSLMRKGGIGCERNADVAIELMETLVEKNNLSARRFVDAIYSDEIGLAHVEECLRERMRDFGWVCYNIHKIKDTNALSEFVEKNSNDACLAGMFFCAGLSVRRNLAIGYTLIRRSALENQKELSLILAGLMSKNGIGTIVDEEAAYRFYLNAVEKSLEAERS